MKTRILVLAVMIVLTGSELFSQKVEINTKASSLEWHAKKIGTKHEGKIQLKSGYLELQDETIVTGKVIVDMTTITNSDLENENYNQKLVGHLKSDDFFGVDTYPIASFEISQGSGFNDGKARLSGKITIKGKTESISFDVVKAGNEYTATVDLDRSKFDVRYGSDSFFDNLGDSAIDDIFVLNIRLVVI